MKRILLGLVLGALIFGVSFAGAKVATVTNPMSADLDGGGNDITHVRYYQGIDTDLGAIHTREAFVSGSLKAAHVNLAIGDGFVDVTAGTASPVGTGTPGLYIQDLGDSSVAVWAKTGADASAWTRLTP